ncbi:ABC transporter permease [Candidatus Amarobacter glycogenicus]|uniref:ABC transporter permease n=1 Tax=Candidatus Amarobacter glycogenicus TaxID=3140699 RepID=UPI003136887D|nr:ABC transporter permease [Dehalococcoidia bacterium]
MQNQARTVPSLSPEDFLLRRRPPILLDFPRRLAREKPLGFAGAVIVIVFALAALLAPIVAPFDPNRIAAGPRLISPAASHFLGTDNLGRDVFSRVIYAGRVSMRVGLFAVLLGTTLSVTIGIVSGYFGGWIDMLFQRLIDAWIAFPAIIFVMVLISVTGPGIWWLTLAIGMQLGVGSSRIIRSATLSVKSMPFVEAARSLGAANPRILARHILPNVIAPAITLATLGLGSAILIESSLSFLGLGVPPDQPTWGGLLSQGRAFMLDAPWLVIVPGMALSLAVFGFNMLGDALRDLLDPRLRKA